MANVTKVKELIEKSKHYDADERFMAILDLIEQIKQAAAIDPIIQSIIRDAVLKALDDGSSDVATCAVKCLSELVPKLLAEQTTFVIESLGRLLVDKEKSSRRDIVTDGLKSVIHCLSIDQGKDGAAKLVKNLISGLSHTPTKEIEMEMACLTVLKELLERFGNDLAEFHSQLLSVLQPLLDHPSDSVRKAASEALGPLVLVLDDKSFTSLMDHIVAAITNKGKRPETYIQAVSAISRAAGVRVGPFLHSLVPQLASYLPKEKVNKEQTEATEELWETVLIAFESLLISCPAQIRDYVPQILHISLEMAKHDPLFIAPAADENNHKPASGGDDEWGNDGGDDGWGDSGDAKGADGWGDDDGTAAAIVSASGDASWRVRRSAVRVISAVIRSKYDKLKDFYLLICKVLVDRFRERDGAVKEEVLLAAREAVRESVVVGKIEAADDSELPSLAIPLLQRQKSVTEILIEVLPDLMKALLEQFNGADVRTRRALFAVLSELLIVRRGVSLDDYLNALVPHVIAGVEASGKTSEVSADAIRVLHLLFEYHKELPSLSNHLNAFSSSLVNAIKNGLPKNIPDALSAISALSRILHGKSLIDEAVNELFSVTFHELQQKDVPLNVKLASLHTISVIVYHHGDLFPSMVPKVIAMLIERLNNDATRQPTLKAIHKIAHSSIKFDLSPIVNHTEEMVSFMRKAFHHIKDDTVRAFESLIKAQPSLYSSKDIQSIVGEASQHLADTDLQLAHNILDLATTIVSHCPSSHEIIAANILPRIVRLVSSPLLQGSALHALVKFLQTCTAHSKNAQLTFDSLLSLLLAQVNADLSKSAAASIAKCIAGITLKSSSLDATVHRFIDLADPKNPKHDQVQVALLTLGDIGKSHDLSNHKQIVDVLLKSFDASNENVRSAGAFALGNSTAGNMNVFLPTLIQLCKTRTSHVYLLFSSLREVITAFSGTEKERARLQVHVPSITPLLFDQAEAKDEAVRSMAAECLGRLAIIEPEKLLISLAELLSRKSELARGVAISAVRFALSDVIDPSLLKARLTPFVKLINDPDLEVRRQCFLTIVAILRFNSSLFSKELMEDVIIPSLYSETQPKPELIYEMDYGAFKKKVDTGKSVRKAAFQCLATLVEVSADRLKLSEFIDHVKHGLIDEEDIQISTYQIFIYVAQNHGTALLEFLDALPKFIMATVKAHLAAAKSQTADPAVHECLRSVVRALASFNAIVGIQLCKDFIHFSRQVAATEPLKPYIQELTGKK